MGYSPEFLRGILSLITLIAAAGILAATANEVIGLGWFESGYPGDGSFWAFVLALGAVIAVSWALGVLIDRLDR